MVCHHVEYFGIAIDIDVPALGQGGTSGDFITKIPSLPFPTSIVISDLLAMLR